VKPAREPSPVLTEPPPDVDGLWVERLLRREYGSTATTTPLRSERDRNFLARRADGWSVVVKISNSAEDPAVVNMENAAMAHVRRGDPDLTIPRVVPTEAGLSVVAATADDGRKHLVRAVTVLPGAAADTIGLAPDFPRDLGDWAARLSGALTDFDHPGGHRALEWDPRLVHDLSAYTELLPTTRHAQVMRLLQRLDGVAESTSGLPSSVLHADVTMSNVMVSGNSISGIIDFGDAHHTARVCDLAITLASLLRVVALDATDPWQATTDLLDGYQNRTPLAADELEVLGELVLARLVATVLISAWRAPDNPDNLDYLTGLDAGSWLMLDELGALPPADLAHRLRHP
jgi:Ser/Thr protein kinase RdoA (MazF antagonist)